MTRKIIDRKLLLEFTKEKLVDEILQLHKKANSQSFKLQELEQVLILRNKKIDSLHEEINLLKNNQKKQVVINQYENLIRDYRLEISDLKDEIEVWKERFKNK